MKRIDNSRETSWSHFREWIWYDNAWICSRGKMFETAPGFFELSDEEVNLLKENKEKNYVVDGDKIFLSKTVPFPKSLINKMNLPITKGNSAGKAVKIVIPDNAKGVIEDFQKKGELVYMFHSIYNNWLFVSCEHLKAVGKTIEDLRDNYLNKYWSGCYDEPVLCYMAPRGMDPNYLFKDKIVYFSDFIPYLYSKLPTITPEIRTNLISMIKSEENSMVKLAVDNLVLYNLSGILFDLYWALSYDAIGHKPGAYNSSPITESVNFKYLMQCMGVNGNLLMSAYSGTRRQIIYELLEKGFLDEEQQFRARIGYHISSYCGLHEKLPSYYAEDIEKLGLSTTLDDTDGKTIACYRELEGS